MHSYGTSTSPISHCSHMEHLETSEEIWVSPTLKTSPFVIKFCKKIDNKLHLRFFQRELVPQSLPKLHIFNLTCGEYSMCRDEFHMRVFNMWRVGKNIQHSQYCQTPKQGLTTEYKNFGFSNKYLNFTIKGLTMCVGKRPRLPVICQNYFETKTVSLREFSFVYPEKKK